MDSDRQRKLHEAAQRARQLEAAKRKQAAEAILAAQPRPKVDLIDLLDREEPPQPQPQRQQQAQRKRKRRKKAPPIPFDAARELAAIKDRRDITRRRRYRPSKLERYRAELVALRRAGASLRDLVVFLKGKRCPADPSTVHRYLAKLPELATPKEV